MKNKMVAGGITVVLGLVLVIVLLIKSRPTQAQAQAQAQEWTEEEQKAFPASKPAGGKSPGGNDPFLALAKSDLEERRVTFVNMRVFQDKEVPGRVKMVLLLDREGIGYPLFNESPEKGKFEGKQPRDFKMGKEYVVRGKPGMYRGKKQFEIREWE